MITKTPVADRALLISGAHVVCPASGLNGRFDVLVERGNISAVAKPGELKSKASAIKAEIFQAKGLVLAPGFVDLQTWIWEPGQENLEGFASAGRAAAAGGFTLVSPMPATSPLHDNAFMTDFIQRRAREHSMVKVLPVGALTQGREGKRLAEIGAMAAAGVRAVGDGIPLMDTYLMRKALEYCRGFGVTVYSRAEDQALVGAGLMHEGFSSNRLGLRGIPAAAEEIMVWRDIVLAKHTKGRVHFSSISTKGAVEAVRRGKEMGLAISAETNPHYLAFTCNDVDSWDPNLKVFPPLRTPDDVAALRDALADGTIDALATQHMPRSSSSKAQSFELAEPGMIGLETAFSVLAGLVHEKSLSPKRLVELLSSGPARILGIEDRGAGSIRRGAPADLVVLEPGAAFTPRAENCQSGAKNSPFFGRKMRGQVRATIVNGTVVYQSKGKIG